MVLPIAMAASSALSSFSAISGVVTGFVDTVGQFFTNFVTRVKEVVDTAKEKFGEFTDKLEGLYEKYLAPFIDPLIDFLVGLWESIPSLPDMLQTVIDLFTGEGAFEGMSIGDRLDFVLDELPAPLSYIVDLFRGEGVFAPGLSIGDRFNLVLDDVPAPFSFIIDLFRGEGPFEGMSLKDRVSLVFDALPAPFSYIVDLFRGEGAFAGMSLKDRILLKLDALPAPFSIIVDFFQGEGPFEGMSLKDRLNMVIPDLPAPFGTVVDFFLGNPPFENMSLKERVNFAIDSLPEPFKSIIDWVKGDLSFGDMITNTLTALNDMAERFLGALWDKLPGWLQDFINWVVEGAGEVIGGAKDVAGGAWDKAKGVGSWAKSGLGFQHGGIAEGPLSGHMEMLHGTEAVVPLGAGKSIPVELMGDNLSGGQTFNMSFNLSGMTDRTDKRDFARQVSDIIQQELRRTVGAGTTRGRY